MADPGDVPGPAITTLSKGHNSVIIRAKDLSVWGWKQIDGKSKQPCALLVLEFEFPDTKKHLMDVVVGEIKLPDNVTVNQVLTNWMKFIESQDVTRTTVYGNGSGITIEGWRETLSCNFGIEIPADTADNTIRWRVQDDWDANISVFERKVCAVVELDFHDTVYPTLPEAFAVACGIHSHEKLYNRREAPLRRLRCALRRDRVDGVPGRTVPGYTLINMMIDEAIRERTTCLAYRACKAALDLQDEPSE